MKVSNLVVMDETGKELLKASNAIVILKKIPWWKRLWRKFTCL